MNNNTANKLNSEPLANKIRPLSLDDFVGQSHLVGKDKPIRKAIETHHLISMILWGPSGVGKTTLARIYANALGARFFELSAVSAGKSDVRELVEITENANDEIPTILFLDEIHRFNKSQQDFLLPFVENGTLTLIGATTENPSFEVISPLLSRCRVFVLNELNRDEMNVIISRAIDTLGKNVNIDDESREWLVNMANGDARQAISVMENSHRLYKKINVSTLKQTIQNKFLRYDKKGEEHYNTISAFIKSMRAGDANAGLYYLARMVETGEDPLFIARRMVIFASEDVGMAQPYALLMANAVFRACETIGYPECAINLAHGVVYLSRCKKDRSSYNGLRAAQKDVEKFGNLQIPMKIRNAPTNLMKDLGYGKDYEMYDTKSLLPDELKDHKYI